ncbi:hypothetical protein Ahy_B10g100463 [Arachis hypogaea]|uniref:DNA-directed RNA polymerase n=1 Tax=Arachis hypogaea TaxID=3818 RepID=A0A444WWS6_ARAHY|nr:hypothetical protein Ahy_B10g100463 [Arachis hypogaea]
MNTPTLRIQVSSSKETCLKLPIGGRGRVVDIRWIQKKKKKKREIKVGDKVAGRHRNKGIVSKILPRQDMPYLQNGRPVDMVFNPLGVPSRMNIGQIFECSLGLAGNMLDRHYRIVTFDERYEQEASRKLPVNKRRIREYLNSSIRTKAEYLMEEQGILLNSLGRAKQGGQRVGEMEVWALEGFGVAHILQEMLTYKSDHIKARQIVLATTIIGRIIPKPANVPKSFRLLIRELRSISSYGIESFPCI